jgi:hypothetical protein
MTIQIIVVAATWFVVGWVCYRMGYRDGGYDVRHGKVERW